MIDRSMLLFCVILLVLSGHSPLWAQTADTLYITTTDATGKPLANVTINIENKHSLLSDNQGDAQLILKQKVQRPRQVVAYKRGYELSTWSFSEDVLEVILTRKNYKYLYGIVEDMQGKPMRNIEVVVQDSTDARYTKSTNAIGVFRMILPLSFGLDSDAAFTVAGRQIVQKSFLENDTAYVAILKTNLSTASTDMANERSEAVAPLTVAAADSTIERINNFYLNQSVADSLMMQAEVSQNIQGIIDDIAIDQQFLMEQNKRLEKDIEILNNKLDTIKDVSPERRMQLLAQLSQLENLLMENELLFKSSFKGSMSVIDRLRESVQNQQTRIENIEREKAMEREAYRQKIFIVTGIIIYLVLIISLFLFLLRKLRVKTAQLEKANHTINEVNANLEQVVAQRTEQLRETNKELDLFLYKSSHDLRRPLTTFLGLSNLVRNISDDGNIIQILDKIDLTAAQMDRLLRKLIHIHQINNKLQLESIDVGSIVDKLKDQFSAQLDRKRIDLQYSSDGVPIQADGEIIEIMLYHLIENSMAFGSKEANRQAVIVVDCSVNDGMAVLSVRDNGCGISKRIQADVFDMFYIGSQTSEGNGLGLYVVKKGAERLQSEVKLESAQDEYTQISILIPQIVLELAEH